MSKTIVQHYKVSIDTQYDDIEYNFDLHYDILEDDVSGFQRATTTSITKLFTWMDEVVEDGLHAIRMDFGPVPIINNFNELNDLKKWSRDSTKLNFK